MLTHFACRPGSRTLGTLLALLLSNSAFADPVTTSTLGWAVNGIVSEVARAGDVAFLGGSFGTVAPSSNLVFGFATFATDSAVPVLPTLKVNNRVRAVVALPGGGWLIGGDFTNVNGTSRQRLARLMPDGSLDAGFSLAANGSVRTMIVANDRIYLGGSFSQIGTTTRERLAALDAATLALDPTFGPSVSGGSATVYALDVSGGSLYVGGAFTTMNAASHANLSAVDTTTGATVVAFTGTTDGAVKSLALGGTALYVGGEFNSAGGSLRRGVAKLSATTGAADTAFDANSNGNVTSVAVSGSSLFVTGSFGQIGGASREHVAALSATTGVASGWNPGASGDVEAMALVGTTLVVVGDFEQVGGVERLHAAALDTTRLTDIALPWNPSLEDGADTVLVDAAGLVFISGDFNFYGAVKRQNLAAIDLFTGELLPWNPGANGWVRALDVLGNTVYVGGDFTTIGGVSRSRIAGLDVVTGVVSSWTANPNARVNGLMVFGDAIYFVGEFSQIKNSTSRGRGAAVATDGSVLPWNPAANGTIETLFVTTGRVFLGGDFTTLGGVAHQRLGAVETTNGAEVAGFAPSVSGSVYRLDVEGNVVFFGGSFGMVNGSSRSNAAAVRTAPGMGDDGQLQGWSPSVSGPIYDLDVFGDVVYLAGGFGSVSGSSRPGIAMVDALPGGGALSAWRPADVNGGAISVIDTSEVAVLFGGLMYDLDGIEIGAVLYPESTLVGAPPPPTTPEILVRGAALTMSWTAPPLGARPTAYVIEGGSGPGLRDLANFSTGNTATTFTTPGLSPGTYYVRMRSQNGYGTGLSTWEQSFVVGAAGCSGPPAAPLDLAAAVNGTSVMLTWRASPQSIVSSHRVLAGSASGVSDLGSFEVGTATSFTATAPPGAYFVRVQAANACGMGAPSAEATAVVGGAAVPPGPAFGLSGRVTGSAVSLTWAPPSIGTGPFQYRVEAGSTPGSSNLAAIDVASTSLGTAGVPPGIYYVRVRALNATGLGPASNEIVLLVP